jgi:MFS family permease
MSSSSFAPKPLQVAAAVVGNAFEWYDFIVFGFFAVVIARLFFPTESQYASLLLTTSTFGVGFFMRPVGGILLGIYADRRGRKASLLLIIGLMTLAIAMIGFAPTYAAIGIAAPLLIVLARLLQGFSAGGEFASATSFLIETAPANRRGFYGSWQMVGQGLALLTGALLGALITRVLAPPPRRDCGFSRNTARTGTTKDAWCGTRRTCQGGASNFRNYRMRYDRVLCNPFVYADVCPHAVASTARSSLYRPGH